MKYKIIDYLHKINILVVIALFFYSIGYFVFFQTSLKQNTANLIDSQANFYAAYWHIILIYFLLYLIIYITIISFIRYRRSKRLKNQEDNGESKKYENFNLGLVSSFLTSILFSFVSLLTLAFYDLVSIKNTNVIFDVKSLMIVIKVSPIIIGAQYPFLFYSFLFITGY